MTPVGNFLSTAGGAVLSGAVAYYVADATSDALVYSILKGQVMKLAEENTELKKLVGEPLRAGAWYDASVGMSHEGQVASCSFRLEGSNYKSDVSIKAVRRGGYRSTLLYNTIGPAEWQIMLCDAAVAATGGLPRSFSLIAPPAPPSADTLAAASAMHGQMGAASVSTEEPQKPVGRERFW